MKKILVSTMSIFAFFISFASAHAGDNDGMSYSNGMMGGFYWPWGMGIIWMIPMILIVIFLMLLIILLIKKINEPKGKVYKK